LDRVDDGAFADHVRDRLAGLSDVLAVTLGGSIDGFIAEAAADPGLLDRAVERSQTLCAGVLAEAGPAPAKWPED
jgi:hypothetical protein